MELHKSQTLISFFKHKLQGLHQLLWYSFLFKMRVVKDMVKVLGTLYRYKTWFWRTLGCMSFWGEEETEGG